MVDTLFQDPPEDCPWTNCNFNADLMEDLFVRAGREIVLTEDFRALVVECLEDRLGTSRSDELAREVEELEKRRADAVEEMRSAAKSASRVKSSHAREAHQDIAHPRERELEELDAHLHQLSRESTQIEQMIAAVPDPGFREIGEAFDTLEFDDLKEVLASLIHHAEFFPDRGEILLALYTHCAG